MFRVLAALALGAYAQQGPDAGLDRLFDRTAAKQAPPPAVEVESVPGLERPLERPSGNLVDTGARVAVLQSGPASPKPAELDPEDWKGLAAAMGDPARGPQALKILSRAVFEEEGGKEARQALHDGLQKLANLKEKDKVQFVKGIDDPLSIVVPIAVSRAPHSFEVHLMADKLWRMLGSEDTTLSAWLAANEADDLSGMLYLRLNVYDSLHAYLNTHPDEARPIAEAVFRNVVGLQSQAYSIQALTERLTGPQAVPAVRDSFALGADEALDDLPKPRSRALALLLSMYPGRFGELDDDIAERARDVLPKPPAVEPSAGPDYKDWPQGVVSAVFHFAHRPTYEGGLKFFLARGYKVTRTDAAGIVLEKNVSGTKVQLLWKVYKSDDEGFLAEGERDRYEAAVQEDLLDPSFQAVFLRAHAEVSQARMFENGASAGKLFFDGSCRGTSVFSSTAEACRTCALIGNVGGGDTTPNDIASFDILESLGAREDWAQIQARLKKDLPATYGRFLGPWAPPYPEALKRLK